LDARPEARFKSEVDEPRKGVRRGNIPTSLNVFFNDLIDAETGTFKDEEELERILREKGVVFEG